jgi:hypothetical protein
MAEPKSLEQIAQEIRNLSFYNQGVSELNPNRAVEAPTTQTGISPITFDIPVSTVYNRLSDGSYVPKFENFAGAIGNEERLAQGQGVFEQMANGLIKNIRKAGNYAIDSVVGLPYGIVNGISEGRLSGVWNNEFSNTIDDWNATLDSKLPNYYTEEEKNRGLLAAIPGFGATNFWFNDVAGGAAFVAGALLPEIAIGILTGGTTAPGTLAKLGFKTVAKGLADEAAEAAAKSALKETSLMAKTIGKVDETIRFTKGRDVLRGLNRAIYGKKVGDLATTSAFLIRSANFEAGLEARQNYKDAVEKYITDFEDSNGRQPTTEELISFMGEAKNAANGVYGANMAILSLSNAAMFGKTLDINIIPNKISQPVTNFFNKAIGLGVTKLDDGARVLQAANKFQKVAGTAFKLLEKPLIEGVYEEGFQGVVGKTMQNYLASTYDAKNNNGDALFSSLTDAFKEQYGTAEGWKEMGIGMIIGFAGGAATGQGLSGLGQNSYSARRSELESDLKKANEGLTTLQTNLDTATSKAYGLNMLRGLTRASSASQSRSEFTVPELDSKRTNFEYIRSQEHLKTKTEMQEDFNFVVDKMELSPAQVDQLASQGMDVESYKQSLKDDFTTTVNDYTFARKAVEALNIPSTITPGNQHNLKEAMMWNIMMGKSAQSYANILGQELEDTVGIGGLLDHMQFYNGLTAEKKQLANQLRGKTKSLNSLRQKAIDIQNQLAGIAPKRGKDATLDRRFTKLTEQYAVASNASAKLEKEIADLEKALEADLRTKDFNLEGKISSDVITNVSQALEEVDKLDTYLESLRTAGKTVEAAQLEAKILEYKVYSDASREFVNAHRRMLATNFFASEEGQGLIGKLVGPKYRMSPDFEQALIENDAVVDRSLKLVGIRGYENVTEYIKQVIEGNDDLSDREKFKLESILRLQLNMTAHNELIDDISRLRQTTATQKETVQGPAMKGDTVTLRIGLNAQADNLTSAKLIGDTINTITTEIDTLRKTVSDPTLIADLEQQLADLEQRRQQILRNQSEAPTVEQQAVAQLQDELAREEASEFRSQQAVDQLKQSISDLQTKIEQDAIEKRKREEQEGRTDGGVSQYQGADGRQQEEGQRTRGEGETAQQAADNRYSNLRSEEEVNEEVDRVTKQLAEARSGISIVRSPEYVRLNELLKKQLDGMITDNEQAELDELKADIDQWLIVTGTVVEGVRLSDLVRQKVMLEQTKVAQVENIDEITEQEILSDVDFAANNARTNYDIALTHEAVTVRLDEKAKKLVLSGIRPEDVPQLFVEEGPDGTEVPIDFEYTIDETNNNVIIPLGENGENLAKINTAQSKISVRPTNKDLVTTYSLVVVHRKDMNGNEQSEYLQSNYAGDYTENQDARAIYELEAPIDENGVIRPGSELFLKVDTRDEYNQNLFYEIEQAKTESERVDKINNLRAKLRITVFTQQGDEAIFVATLKGKRESAKKSATDIQYEMLRDSIVNDPNFLETIAGIKDLHDITLPGTITVKRIFPGQPNFNFQKNPDGSLAVNYVRITPTNAKKVVDIGVATTDGIQTRSKETGIDTTFLKKVSKVPGAKTPFVVLQVGSKKIAYPVRLVEVEGPDMKAFDDVFNSRLSAPDKVVKLNELMAKAGIDIKQPGNFFYAVGNTNNLTSDFFNQKKEQIQDIPRYASTEDWITGRTPISDIVTTQALININMSDPLHSPKLAIDFTNVYAEIAPEAVVNEMMQKQAATFRSTTTSSNNSSKTSARKKKYSNLPSEKDLADSAKDETNKDC